MNKQCGGCCYREWHNGDHSKCNYLIKNECILYEKEVKSWANTPTKKS